MKSKTVPLFMVRDLGATNLDQEKSEVHRAPSPPPSEGSNTLFMELSNPAHDRSMVAMRGGAVTGSCMALLSLRGLLAQFSSGKIFQ